MAEDSWVPVVPVDEVAGPPWPRHEVAGVEVRIVRDAAGDLHVIGARCPHLDSPLDRAEVEGGTLLCPRHWYAYELATGRNVHPGWERDVDLPVFAVRVVDGMVEVAPGIAP